MIDIDHDVLVQSYMRWLALSRWENEGGFGNDPNPPECPPPSQLLLKAPSGQVGASSRKGNRSDDGAK
jgi:hypothetical protein